MGEEGKSQEKIVFISTHYFPSSCVDWWKMRKEKENKPFFPCLERKRSGKKIILFP